MRAAPTLYPKLQSSLAPSPTLRICKRTPKSSRRPSPSETASSPISEQANRPPRLHAHQKPLLPRKTIYLPSRATTRPREGLGQMTAKARTARKSDEAATSTETQNPSLCLPLAHSPSRSQTLTSSTLIATPTAQLQSTSPIPLTAGKSLPARAIVDPRTFPSPPTARPYSFATAQTR